MLSPVESHLLSSIRGIKYKCYLDKRRNYMSDVRLGVRDQQVVKMSTNIYYRIYCYI